MSEQNSSQFNVIYEDENQASSSMFQHDNFQALTMIPSSTSTFNPRLRINPLNTLDFLFVRVSKKLYEILNPKKLTTAIICIEKKPIEELTTMDGDGYTPLLVLLSKPEEFMKEKEYLVPLIQKLKQIPGGLELKNTKGENALFLAAMNFPEKSYVFGYLAVVMLQKGIDINPTLDYYGNTLIHYIAKQGDSHVKVLMEILTLLKDNSALDLSKINNYGQTALHSAVKNHVTNVKILDTTKMLLENGVDLRVKDKNGDTALHLAAAKHCDPELMKILLRFANPTIVSERNYLGDTPLHLAAKLSGNVDLEKQKEVCWLLIRAGALTNVQNT